MDIKLKKNRVNLNTRLFILSILISFLLNLFYFNINYSGESSFYSRPQVIEYFQEYFFYLNQGANKLDGNENLKESAIIEHINNSKKALESNLNYHKEIIDKNKVYDIPEEGYIENINEYNRLKKELDKSNDEFRKSAIDELGQITSGYFDLVKEGSIEYFIETEDPSKPLTNVEGSTKESFLEKTLNNYENYICVYGKSSKKRGIIDISDTMKPLEEAGVLNSLEQYDIYIRLPKELKSTDYLSYEWNEFHKFKNIGYWAKILMGIDILLILLILYGFRKRDKDAFRDNFISRIFGKIYLEIRPLIIVLFIAIPILVMLNSVYYDNNLMHSYMSYVSIIIMEIFLIIGLYLMFLEIYKLLYFDKKEIVSNSVTVKFIRLFRENFVDKYTGVRVTLFILSILCYLTLFAFTFLTIGGYALEPINIVTLTICIIFLGWIIVYILKLGKQVNKIKKATDNIVKGNYKNEVEVRGPKVIKDIARNIVNIEEGFESAVDKAISSEKMKGELITNVSHDLKTPLTSIINYVDLLDKEGISEEERAKYIGVLKEKSSRLKILIEDLFEASKAASGALELEIVILDPVALLRQTIGELEDKIDEAGIQIVKNIPEEKLLVLADGKKTFRIFQNLLSNIIKYSMKNSRVYIDVFEEEEYINITFKNISEHQLNFSPEELMERFKRGDASRTTEGSGLGLSIAKSLVELQKGVFEIQIDGDLFKAIVKLRKEDLDK